MATPASTGAVVTGLVEFLTARLNEIRQRALDASVESPTWTVETHHDRTSGHDTGSEVVCEGNGDGGCETVHAIHIAYHDPARVLADIDAKLRIVDLYTHVRYNDDGEPYFCGSGEEIWYESLCLLALPYADHEDYRQEWAL